MSFYPHNFLILSNLVIMVHLIVRITSVNNLLDKYSVSIIAFTKAFNNVILAFDRVTLLKCNYRKTLYKINDNVYFSVC